MTLGNRSRRVAAGWAVLALVAMGGCHGMPAARVAPTPNRPQSTLALAGRAALMPATVAMDPPSEMASIEPVKTAASSITLAEPPDSPTPLLDAALEKTRIIEERSVPPPVAPISPPTINNSPPSPSVLTHPEPGSVPSLIQLPTTNPSRVETVRFSPTFPTIVPPKAAEPEPARPEDLWRDGVRRLVSLAHAKIEQHGGSGPAAPWGLRARILAWLAEPDLDPEFGPHELDGVRSVLRALDEPPGDSPRRGDEVRSAVLVLEDKAPLEIVDLRVCSKVDGYGDFEAFEPPVRKAGQQIILYSEVDGLRFEQTASGFRTRISAQFEILAEGSSTPIHARSLGTAEEVCRRRRRDYYIPYLVVLPKPLPPGDYRIRLTERDLNSDRSAIREVSFAISKD